MTVSTPPRVTGDARTHPISESCLEHRAVRSGPARRDGGMVNAELQKVAKDGHPRNLREVLDPWNISGVGRSEEEKDDQRPAGQGDELRGHCFLAAGGPAVRSNAA